MGSNVIKTIMVMIKKDYYSHKSTFCGGTPTAVVREDRRTNNNNIVRWRDPPLTPSCLSVSGGSSSRTVALRHETLVARDAIREPMYHSVSRFVVPN